MRNFLESLSDRNSLLESVGFDINEPAFLAGARAFGITDEIITGPYWRLLVCLFVCLFVCGVSLTSGQLVSELFPDCTRSCFSQVVLRHRGGDRIYEMRSLFVAVGLSARFIVLPHWDNMS